MSVPTTSYNPLIPQAGDQLSQSQGDILNNFGALQTWIDVNHVDYADATNAGKHVMSTYPVQSPAPTITPPDIGLYSFNNATTTHNELYFSNYAGTQIPVSASHQAAAGWSYLPSGLILLWFNISPLVAGNNVFTFSSVSGFPGYSTGAFSAQVILVNGSSTSGSTDSVRLSSFNATTLTAFAIAPTGTSTANCFVIGA